MALATTIASSSGGRAKSGDMARRYPRAPRRRASHRAARVVLGRARRRAAQQGSDVPEPRARHDRVEIADAHYDVVADEEVVELRVVVRDPRWDAARQRSCELGA